MKVKKFQVNRMTGLLLIALLILPIYSFAEPDSEKCLQYGPARVAIYGEIQKETFPGPPNYENIEKGDLPETQWLLKLTYPTCVIANQLYDPDFVAEQDIAYVTLVIPGRHGYKRYENLLSKKVVVSGKLFHAFTGHHHTRILITVSEIIPVAD